MECPTTLILRSTDRTLSSDSHADYVVKLPSHSQPQGQFVMRLVSTCIMLSGTDAPVSVHCSLGSGAGVVDTRTGGSSDCIAVLNSTLDSSLSAPLITCPAAGTWNEVRVTLRDIQTYAVRTDVTHATLVIQLNKI